MLGRRARRPGQRGLASVTKRAADEQLLLQEELIERQVDRPAPDKAYLLRARLFFTHVAGGRNWSGPPPSDAQYSSDAPSHPANSLRAR
mmetsp:Transcript_11530/g.36991  ORF Transcript_11530/g.36991 Transcript_11530/m.36991 type:complete len:89 (+) Transcript_11530:1957-2223(+)